MNLNVIIKAIMGTIDTINKYNVYKKVIVGLK